MVEKNDFLKKNLMLTFFLFFTFVNFQIFNFF